MASVPGIQPADAAVPAPVAPPVPGVAVADRGRRDHGGRGLWGTAEGFGEILSGSATDPNTGPLLVLIAAAFWPYPRSATAFIRSSVARIPVRLVRRRARPATLQ